MRPHQFRYKTKHKPKNNAWKGTYPEDSTLTKYKKILSELDPVKYPPNNSNPFKEKYSDIHGFFGNTEPPEPVPVTKPTPESAIITEHEEASVLYYNVNSIQGMDRRERVRSGVLKDKTQVVILAETKLAVDDPEFQIPGYYLVKDLVRKEGAGGMLVLARNEINITHEKAKSVVKEVQVISFMINDHLVIGVYRSPTYIGPELNQHEKLIHYLSMLLTKHPLGAPFTLCGDFNLPDLAACNFRPSHRTFDFSQPYNDRKESKNQLYSDFWSRFSLKNHNHEPSRENSNNTLDLLVNNSSDEPPQFKVDRLAFNGLSDHFPLFFTIVVKYTTENSMNVRRQTHPKNVTNFVNRMEARNLQAHCPGGSGADMIHYVQNELKFGFDQECPYVEVKPPPIRGYFSKDTVHHMRQTNRLKYTLRNFNQNEQAYHDIKAKLVTMKKYTRFMCKRDRNLNDVRKFKTSANKKRNFYKHCKKAKSKSSKIGPIKDPDDNLISDKSEITNVFGEYFNRELNPELTFAELLEIQENCLTFMIMPECILNVGALPYPGWTGGKQFPDWFNPHPDSPDDLLTHAYISTEMVEEQIKKANRASAAGPDDLPMLAFSVTAHIIAPILAVAFTLINQSGQIPEAFKQSKVKLIFKKKDKSDMANYRPIAMSNQIGKIWERCLNSMIILHLEANGLISNSQEGFRPNRGTDSNLNKMWAKVTSEVEKHRSLVELWNFDLTKAFDRLNHSKVLHLCHIAGIGGFVGVCLQNWLTTRTQYVEIGVHRSPETDVGMSCVQGSVLGPTLWIIYINSLLARLEKSKLDISIFAYADDLSIVKHIKTDAEFVTFNDALDILDVWAKEFNMTWSPLKTQRLIFRHKGGTDPTPKFILFDGKIIHPMETKSMKTKCISLGVIVNRDLTFGEHIKRVVNDLKSQTSNMKRFFSDIDEYLLKNFYQSYMLPKFTYGSTVWNPMSETALRGINKEVENFWKQNKCRGPNGGAPPDILEPSLQLILIDLIYVHRMYRGKTSIDFHEFFKFSEANTRQCTFKKLMLPLWKLKFSRNKLTFRAVLSFNLLPKGSWDLTKGQFKRMAKQFILDNKQEFVNLTLNFSVSGKFTSAPSEAVSSKIRELKDLNKPGRLNLGYIFENAPIQKEGSEKFWIQSKAPGFQGFKGQKIPRMLKCLFG